MIDKFIGDTVLAMFGGLAPLGNPAEAARGNACDAVALGGALPASTWSRLRSLEKWPRRRARSRGASTLARNDPGLLVKNDPVGARVIEVG